MQNASLLREACMLASELAVGVDYAHRANPQDTGCGLQKVTFIGPARAGKAKVRHRDGDLDGLQEWLRTRSLMCVWADRRALLRDESRQEALQQAARDHDPVVEEAISTVFEATGDESGFIRVWTVSPERARRLSAAGGPARHARSPSSCLHRPARPDEPAVRDGSGVRFCLRCRRA